MPLFNQLSLKKRNHKQTQFNQISLLKQQKSKHFDENPKTKIKPNQIQHTQSSDLAIS